MEHVQVCRFCGHIDSVDDAGRCNHCRFFSGLTSVTRAEAKRISRGRRFSLLRSRLLRLGLVLALIAGLGVWVMWNLFDLAPNPPGATTNISASVGPHTWAQGRRVPQNSGFTPDPAPIPQKVKWTYATSQPLLSSPAVVEDRVYLTTEDGRAVALDRETGQEVWQYEGGSPSNTTPAVVEDLVFFTLRPGLVVALDRENGSLRWEKDIGNAILASPIVVNGTLYIGAADRKLYALDAATGRERWAFATSNWVISSVAYADDTVIVTSQDNLNYILDEQTGRKRLDYDTGRGRRTLGAPAIKGDLVYLGSYGGRVWAINRRAKNHPLDGTILYWKTSLHLWGVLPNPPVQRGSVWAAQLEGDVTQTLAVAHDMVYVTNTDGKVFALDAATGTEEWATDLGVKITAAPTVAGRTVLVGTHGGAVFGLDGSTGAVLWDFKTGGKITGSPIVAGDTMYIASHDGKLYAVTDIE